MSKQRMVWVCLVVVLSLVSGVWAASPFSLRSTFDVEIGNDSGMGPGSSSATGTGMGIRNVSTRRRVSLVTYDISSVKVSGQMFQNVSLSSLGHNISGLVDVYGIIESQEHVVASGVNWNTAPGVKNNPTPALDSDVTLDLADLTGVLVSFTTPAQGVRASSDKSQALADFLNSDTDGFVAILLAPNGSCNAIIRTMELADTGGLWLEGEMGGAPAQARDPNPADGATDVWRDTVLSWTPATVAATRNVYLGTSLADVAAAKESGAANVLSSVGQTASTYDPPGHLAFGQTYYWRVDEVNGAPDFTVHAGAVWSFTTEPFAREVKNIVATASSSDAAGGPQYTVDGTGLDSNGLHSTVDKAMWLSAKTGPQPTWIKYEMPRVYKLYEMRVWNYNMSVESVLGVGCKAVTVEYSADGTNWTALGDFEFAQGTSTEGYASNTTVNFDGVAAKYVRLTPKSNWGGIVTQYGLSEVKFFYIPVHATNPTPTAGATGISPDVTLGWQGGREAASHEVYFSADQQAVVGGTALAGTVSQNSYDSGSLNLQFGKTYYWKVVEVNQATTPSAWESDLWSFSTMEFSPIDDFESYTNESPNRVFQTWIDGWGFSEDAYFSTANPGNGSGSMVGYDPEAGAIMETAVIHGGKQAMPVEYNNVNSPYYSQTDRIWETPQNWTTNGADTLRVWFRGNPVDFVQNSANSFTMGAGGTDIYGTSDQFTFTYKLLSGDGTIIAKVDSIENANEWAKAGVMIRESLSPDSRFAGVYATPGQGVRFQARLLNAGDATSDTSVATDAQKALKAPVWVKLERTGTTVNAYYSTDGAKWTSMSWNPQTLSLVGTVYIGMAVTSHNTSVATTGVFSNVSTSGGVSGSWTFAEIGIDHLLNDPDTLYAMVKDSAGKTATVIHPDANAVLQNTWQAWNIPLAELRSAGVNVASVKSLSIGVGNRKNPTASGSGRIFIDDIGFGRAAQ